MYQYVANAPPAGQMLVKIGINIWRILPQEEAVKLVPLAYLHDLTLWEWPNVGYRAKQDSKALAL